MAEPLEADWKVRDAEVRKEAHEILRRGIAWPLGTTFKSALHGVLSASLLNKTLAKNATISIQIIVETE